MSIEKECDAQAAALAFERVFFSVSRHFRHFPVAIPRNSKIHNQREGVFESRGRKGFSSGVKGFFSSVAPYERGCACAQGCRTGWSMGGCVWPPAQVGGLAGGWAGVP